MILLSVLTHMFYSITEYEICQCRLRRRFCDENLTRTLELDLDLLGDAME